MSGWRPDAEVFVEPGVCEGLVDGSGLQLVTLRLLFAGEHERHLPDALTHLRPREARALAGELLACAEHADRLSDRAG